MSRQRDVSRRGPRTRHALAAFFGDRSRRDPRSNRASNVRPSSRVRDVAHRKRRRRLERTRDPGRELRGCRRRARCFPRARARRRMEHRTGGPARGRPTACASTRSPVRSFLASRPDTFCPYSFRVHARSVERLGTSRNRDGHRRRPCPASGVRIGGREAQSVERSTGPRRNRPRAKSGAGREHRHRRLHLGGVGARSVPRLFARPLERPDLRCG